MTVEPGQVYSAEDIQVVEGLEHVRRRPAMYVGDVGVRGLHELAWIPLRNAVDEVLAGDATRVAITLLPGNAVRVEDDGPGFPVAVHPRVQRSILELIFTIVAGCGCGCSEPAGHRRSLVDVGLCAVNALSSRVEVETRREGRTWRLVLSRGEVIEALQDLGPTALRGAVVTVTPDAEIFGGARFSWARLVRRAREVSAAVPTLTVTVRDARPRTAREVVVRSPRGVADLVVATAPHGRWPAPLVARSAEGEVEVEVALQVHDGPSRFVGLVNAEPLGGVHVTALRRALRLGLAGRGQVVAAVSVFMRDPSLSDWLRPRLEDGPERVSEHVARTVREALARASEPQVARGRGRRSRNRGPDA